jgi:hypothetical protein
MHDNQNTTPRVSVFLTAVEAKTDNEVHRRLLRACRTESPDADMEAELKRILDELLDEDK